METNFNHEQSLALISEMIQRARNNVKRGSTYSMIYWGYVTAALAIANYVLMHTLADANKSFFIWFLMIPAAVIGVWVERRANRSNLVKTHIDKIAATVWTGFLISYGVAMVVIHVIAGYYEVYQLFTLITPVIVILIGMGQFISACIYRSKLWYAIAALSWTGAIACAFVSVDIQFLILAVTMILGFVIPGHVLNHQARQNHV
ncbi:MAG: hypothetical protein LBE56_08325 [Tannerella sp.]|jgi:MFS family permease|nr:hypothetical protein [Tannerella sp.]